MLHGREVDAEERPYRVTIGFHRDGERHFLGSVVLRATTEIDAQQRAFRLLDDMRSHGLGWAEAELVADDPTTTAIASNRAEQTAE